MPREYVHGLHFDVLHREHLDLVRINTRLFQQAMDVPRRIFLDAIDLPDVVKKKMTHTDFDMFLKEYERVTNEVADVKMVHSLKYYWVNHLCVDMVQNKEKYFLPTWRELYKRVSNLGEPYNSYGLRLLIRMGVSLENIKMSSSGKYLNVSKLYRVNPARIGFKEPLRSIIYHDYLVAASHRLDNAEHYGQRLENRDNNKRGVNYV